MPSQHLLHINIPMRVSFEPIIQVIKDGRTRVFRIHIDEQIDDLEHWCHELYAILQIDFDTENFFKRFQKILLHCNCLLLRLFVHKTIDD
jgi:hypothetical protein